MAAYGTALGIELGAQLATFLGVDLSPRGSAPPPAPTPASILGALLNVEYRANDPLISVSGGVVSTWPAFNAGAGDMVQAVVLNKPAFSATGYRGTYPGVTLDTAVKQMRSTLTTEITTPYRPYVFVLGQYTSAGGAKFSVLVGSTSGPFTEFCYVGTDGASRHSIGDGVAGESSAVVAGTGPHLLEWTRRDSTQVCLRIDGVDALTPASTNAGTLNLGHVQIGQGTGFAAPITLAHIVVCNSRPSAQQLLDMRAYFAAAYP